MCKRERHNPGKSNYESKRWQVTGKVSGVQSIKMCKEVYRGNACKYNTRMLSFTNTDQRISLYAP
jgi:hypothetical protein